MAWKLRYLECLTSGPSTRITHQQYCRVEQGLAWAKQDKRYRAPDSKSSETVNSEIDKPSTSWARALHRPRLQFALKNVKEMTRRRIILFIFFFNLVSLHSKIIVYYSCYCYCYCYTTTAQSHWFFAEPITARPHSILPPLFFKSSR